MNVVSKNEYWENEQRKKQAIKSNVVVRYAHVVELVSGKPIIRFAGATESSKKRYRYLKSYVPAVGDRVMVVDGIIVGGWKP